MTNIVGMELMHAAQGIELRSRIEQKHSSKSEKASDVLCITIGHSTRNVFTAFRKTQAFFDIDRPLTPEVARSKEFVLKFVMT